MMKWILIGQTPLLQIRKNHMHQNRPFYLFLPFLINTPMKTFHRGRSEIFIGQPNQHAGETLKCPYCADYFTDANRHYRCGFCKKYCHASHLSEVVSVGQG
eukprot:431304_1